MAGTGKVSRRGLLGAAAAVGAAAMASRTERAVAAGHGGRRTRLLPGERAPGQLPPRGEYLVRGAYVLTMDPALGDLAPGEVHVRDGAIVAVGTDLAAPGAEVIDGRNAIVLPGLVETHWHLWNGIVRTLAWPGTPVAYFPLVMRLGQHYTPEDAYRAVRLGVTEAVNGGLTTVHNWAHNIRSQAQAAAEVRAMADSGIRGRFSYGHPQGLPADQPMDREGLARTQRELFGASSDGLLQLGMASRSPSDISAVHTADPPVLDADWQWARSLGLPITLHSSTAGDPQRWAAGGWLGPDVQVVHGGRFTPADNLVVAESGSSISFAPWAELRGLLGYPQVKEMMELGVQCSLSFDHSAAVGCADMFATMRLIGTVEIARHGDATQLPARRILELATIDGARGLGLADKVGSLTPGKRADLILVRTTDLNMQPLVEPVQAIVVSAQPANVDTVLVDGRILKRGGQLTAVDVEKVGREASETLALLRERAGWP